VINSKTEEMKNMESYNIHLYHARLTRNLKRKEFARLLGLNRLTYKAIEQGYIKPTRKQIKKISEALNEDYSVYLEGDFSYPIPLPEGKETKITSWFYNLISKLPFKIVILVLLLCSFGVFGTGIYYGDQYDKHSRDSFSENYGSFYDSLKEKGTLSLSITGDLKKPEFYYQDETRFYSLKGSYNKDTYSVLSASAAYHTADYRISYTLGMGDKPLLVSAKFVTYKDGITYHLDYTEENKDEYVFDYFLDDSGKLSSDRAEDAEVIEGIKANVELYLPEINTYFDKLILDKTGVSYSFFEGLANDYYLGGKYLGRLSSMSLLLLIISAISSAGFLFLLIHCNISGKKKGSTHFYKLEISSDDLFSGPPAKKDFSFTPFLPETLFEIVGIFFVFFGSLRVLYYVFTFIGVIQINGNDFTNIPNTFFYLFMVGMFLLYFVDFDIFANDKRVFRNIFLYFIIYVLLYFFETILMQELTTSDVLIYKELAAKISIPNNFGTITCYFLMMLTLFYTPKRIKTKKGLTFYRLLTIIPVSIIISSTLIFHYANTSWNWNLSIPVLYLFSSERTQFSLLCIIYLLVLYFLKLFYTKKYGEKKALALMNGNRFLFSKNAIAAGTVLLIGLLEIILLNNNGAHDLGLGKYPYLILLSPFLLFYHPHMGERNNALDYTTTILYVLSFAGGYLLIFIPLVLMVLASLV